MTFREYLKESNNFDAAANDIADALLDGSINKNNNIQNFINSIFKDYKINNDNIDEIIKLVKEKGYTGKLLDNIN